MPFKEARHCKICQSPIRNKIDTMIRKGANAVAIILFAAKHDITISKQIVSRHKLKHCSIKATDLKTRISKANASSRRYYNKSVNKFVASTVFLERITSDVFSRIETGALIPTIDHALKAIELQAKLKEGNLVEKTLIEFMVQFSPDSFPVEPSSVGVLQPSPKEIQQPSPDNTPRQPQPQIANRTNNAEPIKSNIKTKTPEDSSSVKALKEILRASREGELTGSFSEEGEPA